MLKKTIKFINENNEEKSFSNAVNIIKKHESPFKEMITNGDYLSYSLILNDVDEYKITLEETFHLLVNVKGVGSFHFFFISKFFEKNDVIDKILGLKEKEDSKEKVDLLFDVLKPKNILFVIYIAKGETPVNENILETYQENIFYVAEEKPLVKKEETKEEVKEEKVVEEKATKEKKEKRPFLEVLKKFFSPFISDKIRFLFIFVAAVIIGFTISIGIFDYYLDNKIYIFFFIFSFIGAMFNFIVFKDYFKEKDFKINDAILSICALLLGFALSIGLYFIFYNASKNKPESLTNSALPVLISIPIFLGLEAISIILARLLKNLFAKKKED